VDQPTLDIVAYSENNYFKFGLYCIYSSILKTGFVVKNIAIYDMGKRVYFVDLDLITPSNITDVLIYGHSLSDFTTHGIHSILRETKRLTPNRECGIKSLNAKELYLLKLLMSGKSISSISEIVGVQEKTLSSRKYSILRKTDLRNFAELIVMNKQWLSISGNPNFIFSSHPQHVHHE
jgi:DNA-binding CsgD family transcriptional regulator